MWGQPGKGCWSLIGVRRPFSQSVGIGSEQGFTAYTERRGYPCREQGGGRDERLIAYMGIDLKSKTLGIMEVKFLTVRGGSYKSRNKIRIQPCGVILKLGCIRGYRNKYRYKGECVCTCIEYLTLSMGRDLEQYHPNSNEHILAYERLFSSKGIRELWVNG